MVFTTFGFLHQSFVYALLCTNLSGIIIIIIYIRAEAVLLNKCQCLTRCAIAHSPMRFIILGKFDRIGTVLWKLEFVEPSSLWHNADTQNSGGWKNQPIKFKNTNIIYSVLESFLKKSLSNNFFSKKIFFRKISTTFWTKKIVWNLLFSSAPIMIRIICRRLFDKIQKNV